MKTLSALKKETTIHKTVLEAKYKSKLEVNSFLKRTFVSFQANKEEPGYRWYKFKEGFSSTLVEYCLKTLGVSSGELLDPFAGSGTALFTASAKGLHSTGIELLPIASEIIKVRKHALGKDKKRVIHILKTWTEETPWITAKEKSLFPHISLTEGAFPAHNEIQLERYLKTLENVTDKNLRRSLRFAALCILENISYTRKDGQYLRWDHRTTRNLRAKKKFTKTKLLDFDEAIALKLIQMESDLSKSQKEMFPTKNTYDMGKINLLEGSCLEELPRLKSRQFSFLMTSPPYCNRYDYTRTYALELALLGIKDDKVKKLRQTMLSATVENREKEGLNKILTSNLYRNALTSYKTQKALHSILEYLEILKERKELSNSGIVRMVRNYFLEMCFIIFEASRVLKTGSPFVMVNDNVSYAGLGIPVDLILSDFAQDAGFTVEKIWILPKGKGNSSQQMGKYGRIETRKCVYVWRKL